MVKHSLLVTLADRNFIPQAKQLFSSVYWNAGWQGDYMLLAHDIPEEDLRWFREKGILVYQCTPLYEEEIIVHDSVTLLDKFNLFTPEFKKWEHVVFLDADIIVRGSLDKLARVKGFSAVHDVVYPRLGDYFIVENATGFLGEKRKFKLNTPTFISSLLAFPTHIIKDNTFGELKAMLHEYIDISKFSDQSILNLFFYKRWKRLPLAYNVLPMVFTENPALAPRRREEIVLHFVRMSKGPARPWDTENPFYGEWKNNLDGAELINLNRKNDTSTRP